MRYTKLDLTIDGVAGEFGKSADGKSGVSVFATDRKEFNENSIKTFLDTSSDEIPNLKNISVRWKDTPERAPAPAASGIKEAKIWTGSDSQGNSYAAAYLPREDGKGSYLFVYNTTGRGVYENDGTFDLIVQRS